MADKPMITLQVLLEALKDKIDEDYAGRIDRASNLKAVDHWEAAAIEKIEEIEAVKQLAELYYPTEADTDLALLQFQTNAALELLEACEAALPFINQPVIVGKIKAAIAKAKNEATNV